MKSSQRQQGDGEENIASKEQLSDIYDSSVHPSKSNKKLEELNITESLPDVSDVARKLNKLSLINVPDYMLLSQPPLDLENKQKFLMMPTRTFNINKKNSSTFNTKKKEPKFIPYEPYKGCVKPIMQNKKKDKNVLSITSQPASLNIIDNKSAFTEDEIISEKFKIMVSDFEKERNSWEHKNNELKLKSENLEKELSEMKKEFTILQQQLSTQSQVNSELKKLLVASVGEDVQGRVQCLTEDKARMATMIRKYSEKVDRDYEEKEKISIQCDVWRSKFLASSLLIDELARWKGTLLQRFEASKETLKLLLEERDIAHHNLVNAYRHIYQVREGFDPLHAESSGIGLIDSCDLVSLAVATSSTAENVRDRLLGNLGRALGSTDLKLPPETRTPGEKLAYQILEDGIDPSGILVPYSLMPGKAALCHRYHPDVNYEHLTMNCCKNCNGEIKVV